MKAGIVIAIMALGGAAAYFLSRNSSSQSSIVGQIIFWKDPEDWNGDYLSILSETSSQYQIGYGVYPIIHGTFWVSKSEFEAFRQTCTTWQIVGHF